MTSRRFRDAPQAIAALQRSLDDLRKLASRKGHGHVLGYAEVTSNQSGFTAETDLTGLSVTVGVAANRLIRVSVHVHIQVSVDGDASVIRIYEDATHIMSNLNTHTESGTGGRNDYTPFVLSTPAAGIVTYKVTAERFSGTGTVASVASSSNPAHILVEDLGKA